MNTAGVFAQQTPIQLHFYPVLNGTALLVKDEQPGENKDSLRISTFRCYISNVSLWRDKTLFWQEPNSYHLLDAEKPESLQVQMAAPADGLYNSLHFNLGIDSATSASGAHGGELDPAQGMYWAWQSGYINLKLEGASPLCPTRKHEFQFHLGGYQYPFSSMQAVSLEVKPGAEIGIQLELGQFLNGIDLRKQNSVMIPGQEAVSLSRKAALIFHTAQ